MKKIQLGTVKKEANVQVIYLDASFISKAVKAKINADMVSEEMLQKSEEGKFTKQIFLSADSARRTVNEVLPFLQELIDAFEENDEQEQAK